MSSSTRPTIASISMPVEPHALAPVGGGAETGVHGRGDLAMTALVDAFETRAGAGQRHQAVQRAAVEQVPAGAARDGAADGALARATRAVDGHDRGSRAGHPEAASVRAPRSASPRRAPCPRTPGKRSPRSPPRGSRSARVL